MSILLFGAYGTFGGWLSRELAAAGIPFTIAGRNRDKAEAFAKQLGNDPDIQIADVNDFASCVQALRNRTIAVHCAGPFSQSNDALLRACLETGCHYVDIADDREYVAKVRSHHEAFKDRKLSAVFGCSSMPGISGALIALLKEKSVDPPKKIRAVLFIGNRNQKSSGAVESVFKIVGQNISSGLHLIGLRKESRVTLPQPFGKKTALAFESADYDLLPEICGTRNIVVDVCFQLEVANRFFSSLSHLPHGFARLFKYPVLKLGGLFSGSGTDGGGIQVEWMGPAEACTATLFAPHEGQRMAILPALHAIQKILRQSHGHGVFPAYDFLGPGALLEGLTAAGSTLSISNASATDLAKLRY